MPWILGAALDYRYYCRICVRISQLFNILTVLFIFVYSSFLLSILIIIFVMGIPYNKLHRKKLRSITRFHITLVSFFPSQLSEATSTSKVSRHSDLGIGGNGTHTPSFRIGSGQSLRSRSRRGSATWLEVETPWVLVQGWHHRTSAESN